MDDIELKKIWQANNQKIDRLLSINTELAINLTKNKLNNNIGKLILPKSLGVLIGIPYTLILITISIVAILGQAYFVALGFGAISLLMTALIIHYFYQLYLINKIKISDDILSTQQNLSKLKLTSFESLNIAVFQLPFWSVCFMSFDALNESPLLYGGINLIAFSLLTYLSYWLYKKMSYKNVHSEIRDFFLTGREWDPIIKSTELLEQIKEYKNQE